jgi:hypothetical protein
MKLKNTLAQICFLPVCIFAQLNLPFTAHLQRNALQREHEEYLRSIEKTTPSDSIHYAWAKFYLATNNPEQFLSRFESSELIFSRDTQAMNVAAVFALRNPLVASVIFTKEYGNYNMPLHFSRAKLIFQAANQPQTASFEPDDSRLQKEFKTYKRFERKKPFVGGLLSALVPGLGKCYAGRNQSFANVFFVHLLYGATIYESVRKVGLKNPYTLFNLSYCGIFYLSNIYGGYLEVKKVKKEKKKQFLINAARYLENNNNSSLYPQP